MRRFICAMIAIIALFAARNVGAQGMGGGPDSGMPMMRGPGGGGGAADFLAHTAQLQLTDAQVVRLAAIARRGEARRNGMRARMDSLRTTMRPRGDSTRREGRNGPPPAALDAARRGMEQMRDQERADLRDALAVLTPDQLVTAWEMRGRAGGPGGGRGRGMPGGARMRMRSEGPGRAGGPGGPGGPPPQRRGADGSPRY